MNLKTVSLLFSFRKELIFVASVFCLVLLIPIISVILLTHSGIDVISDRLAKIDEKTQTVQLYYPSGKLYKKVDFNIVWPVNGVITKEFGEPGLPYYLFHSGIDIANAEGKKGDPITPAISGKVIYAGEIFWGFGKHIIIDNGDNMTTLYGHLDKIYVVKNQEVKTNQIIGREGSTGWSTGPHLHFQIMVFGIPVNPRTFLGDGNPKAEEL